MTSPIPEPAKQFEELRDSLHNAQDQTLKPPIPLLSEEEVAALEADCALNLEPLAVTDDPELREAYTGRSTEKIQQDSRKHLDHLQPDMDRIEQIKAERLTGRKILHVPLASPMSPHPSHRRKNVTLRYAAKDVGQPTIDLICKRYKDHVPMDGILKQVNARRRIDGLTPLALIDLYAILSNQATTEKNVVQRRHPTNELTLLSFSKFFDSWRNGFTFEQCMAKVLPFKNKYFLQKCHRALMERSREDRKRELSTAIQQEAALTIRNVDQTILRLATKQIIDNVSCLVIPVRKLPTYILAFLKEIPHANGLVESAELTQEQIDIHLLTDPTGESIPVPKLNLREPEPEPYTDPLLKQDKIEDQQRAAEEEARFIPEVEEPPAPSVFDNETIESIQSESADPFDSTEQE